MSGSDEDLTDAERIDDLRDEIAHLREFIGKSEFLSDYRSCDHMRAEIARLTHIIQTHLHERVCVPCRYEYWSAAAAGSKASCPRCGDNHTNRKGGR